MTDVLYGEFDIEVHKKTFIDYFEVVIDENGKVLYAVPSHQEKLISIACSKLKITRDQLNDLCPEDFYCDFMTWLCQITGCISVWINHIHGRPNENQIKTLTTLQEHGLYKV